MECDGRAPARPNADHSEGPSVVSDRRVRWERLLRTGVGTSECEKLSVLHRAAQRLVVSALDDAIFTAQRNRDKDDVSLHRRFLLSLRADAQCAGRRAKGRRSNRFQMGVADSAVR